MPSSTYTNFPNGVTSFGVPMISNGTAPFFTGNWFFVNETTGSDGNTGGAQDPFKTLTQALSQCVSGNNDVVAFTGTIHLTSTLTWSKNNVHLVGMCAPIMRGKRARISVSGTTAFAPLVNVTANGCQFQNFGTFYGFNSASNNNICWQDVGGRNCYNLVEFLGFGDGTASTGTSNISSARALKFNTSTGETTFRSCVFGVDTEQRNAANYTVEISGGAPRLTFEDCDFEAYLGSSGTGSSHFLIGASGIDRYMNIKHCRFYSDTKSGGSAMSQCFNNNAAIGGMILIDQSTATLGITKWETSATNQIEINMTAPSTATGGYAVNNS